MAASKSGEFASSLKQRLDFLDYPGTEGLDQASVAGLLLTPGEGRLQALEWLFSRLDQKLEEFLETSQSAFGIRTESRMQKLLTAACSVCLCQNDDLDLIKGEGSMSRQANFLDRLLDMVCYRERMDLSFLSRSKDNNSAIDALVRQDGFSLFIESRVDLLPRDIQTQVEKQWLKEGWAPDKPFPQSSIQDLVSKTDELTNELIKHKSVLNTLIKQADSRELQNEDQVLNMSHILATVLKELHQLSEGFLHCYQNRMDQWCHRQQQPDSSELGPAFQGVHVSLQPFLQLLEDVKKARDLQAKLNKTMKASEERSHDLVEASKDVSAIYQNCLSVLEEAVHRSEARFCSKYTPVLTLK